MTKARIPLELLGKDLPLFDFYADAGTPNELLVVVMRPHHLDNGKTLLEPLHAKFAALQPCGDCGIDTANHDLKLEPEDPDAGESYMVTNDVWHEAGNVQGFLCIGCLEARLGRQLTPDDFTSSSINDVSELNTPRLNDRLTGGIDPDYYNLLKSTAPPGTVPGESLWR